ncbi:hypothetical protein R1sor_004292 [Riccia sorocarpa]|uniref:HTH CENPB-type domain-containing protein n=1 Tax=Riccia sorocarpa TaxID=122646 RepID=A0ABD3HKL1_9MARC
MAEPSKRRNSTLARKLEIANEYKKGEEGRSYHALAKKYRVGKTSIQEWVKSKDELEDALKDREIQTRKARRLDGGGRKCKYPELEELLVAWVHDKNKRGFRVKEKYIQLKAKNLFTMLNSSNDPYNKDPDFTTDIEFLASNGWLTRFKTRHNLVSRRATSQRIIPENANVIAREFITRCQNLISMHNIKLQNIINMDQVPRYFDTEPKSTVTSKGSRNVLLRKGGTSHKRFTATFTISASGLLMKPHLLFSNLKNVPTVSHGVLVEVNTTGMFNDRILMDCVKNTVLNRAETSFLREPTLYIIDSYGCHVKLATSKALEKYNIFVEVVPERMTSLLQPLDVSVNRSFQEFYSEKYDQYIAQALEDPELQTKACNPKVPGYLLVFKWVKEWGDQVPTDMIQTAFKLCGLVPLEDFQVENCHTPLKALLASTFDPEDWMEHFGDTFNEAEESGGITEEEISPPDWFLPNVGINTGFCGVP